MKSVPIELGGKMRNIRYGYNDACEIEALCGKTLMDVYRSGFVGIRAMLWGGLKWQERGLTPNMVGIWLDEFYEEGGRFDDVNGKVMEALMLSGFMKALTPEEEEVEEEKNE